MLLSKQVGWKKLAPMLRVVGVPIAIWALWGGYTWAVYGEVHFLGSTDVVIDMGKWQADKFWKSHVDDAGLFRCRAVVSDRGVVARAAARFEGDRTRRGGSTARDARRGVRVARRRAPAACSARCHRFRVGGRSVLREASCCARGASGRTLLLADPIDRFLFLWLGGTLFFSMFLNWHVNAADALLAGPPLLLLLFRDLDLRPTATQTLATVGAALPLSFGLAWADMQQANTYRTAAENMASEIGDQSGARYFVGQWGLQHYLELRGFGAVVPPMYGRTDLLPGDWVGDGSQRRPARRQ